MDKGQTFAEQPPEYEFVPNIGWTTIRVFHGAKSTILPMANAFALLGYRVATRGIDGGLHELRASIAKMEGASESPVDTWEIEGSDLQTDIKLLPAFQDLGDAVLEDIEAKVRDAEADVTIPTGDATTLYRMLIRDQTHFQESRYVLRYTQTSSVNYQAAIAVAGVNQLWTLGQIRNAHGGMPANIVTALTNIPTPTLPSGDDAPEHKWRWLKHTPRLSKSAGQQTIITVEWTLYLWPTIIYPDYA